MPKAAVDENSPLPAEEGQIGCAGEVFSMKPITVAKTVGQASNDHFRFHAVTSDRAHIGATTFGTQLVHKCDFLSHKVERQIGNISKAFSLDHVTQ